MKDETQPHDLQQASPLYVASLARGMVLLESFRDGAPLLGITDLVRITGFEKNLVQRLTNTLYQMGYLGKDQARRKYYLTPRILTHSFNYLRSRKLFALAMPALIDLREDLHKAVNMCVLNGTDITYVVRLWLKYYHEASLFGESLPAYSSAGGRMLLSFFSDEDALALIEGMERRKLTPHTRVDPMELLDEVRKAREQGYCWQAGEFIEKEISVSAPVSDADGKPAAIIVTSLLKKVTPETWSGFHRRNPALAPCHSILHLAAGGRSGIIRKKPFRRSQNRHGKSRPYTPPGGFSSLPALEREKTGERSLSSERFPSPGPPPFPRHSSLSNPCLQLSRCVRDSLSGLFSRRFGSTGMGPERAQKNPPTPSRRMSFVDAELAFTPDHGGLHPPFCGLAAPFQNT